jgi:endonuclease/exonuclease/phosphatase family metal-dependent hydrolase
VTALDSTALRALWCVVVPRAFSSVLVALLGACSAPAVEPTDAGTDAGVDAGTPGVTLSIGTFNTHLFFDTVCESGACGPTDFEQAPSQAAFDAKADQLAAVLRNQQVDVAVLQEVETQASLDALASRLAGVFEVSALGEIGLPGSVDVAVLSRGSIERIVTHRADTPLVRPDGSQTVFSRELLEVHLRIDGAPLTVFAAHFRSKNNDDPGRRLAEAQAARVLVLRAAAAEPGVLTVLAGDLNDTPGSPPMEALEADGGLYRVAKELPLDAQATYVFNGAGEAIDHVLEATAPPAYVGGSSAVTRVSRAESSSDHWPLKASFQLPR